MFSRKLYVVLLAAVVAALATVPATRADVGDHTMYLTFNRPVGLPGVALAKGTYIFETPDPIGANGVVRVLSSDRKIVYLTAFTNEVSRPRNGERGPAISFGEAAPDRPVPISVWWSDGSIGRQFIYR
jgi:hypothetical protein